LSPDRDLEHFSESVNDMFARLGLPDPVVMAGISSEWDELAGPPWSGRSKPLYIRAKTLVVEASTPSMVAFLRYGESSLLEKLAERFGKGTIEALDIKSPGRA
jgi:predicted nucleic acid-binding Zn ribbon protein